MKRPCSQLTAAGKPCRGAAVLGSDRCAAHLKLNGRKTKLTPELTARLTQMLRSGVPLATAVPAAGVSKRTYLEWLARDEPMYVAFAEAVEEARARGEAALVAVISRAAPAQWQAAAFLLERGHPERWARLSQRKQEPQPLPETNPFAEFDELAARRTAR